MFSGCCKCKWCGDPTSGEFANRQLGKAHYWCRACHLWYSHEIADLEAEDGVLDAVGLVVPVPNAHACTF